MAKKKLIIFIIIAAIILFIIFLPGYTKLQDLIAENKRMEKKIQELERSITNLTTEKARLRSDVGYIEKTARDKMGVIKEGEKKIEFQK